MYYRLEENKATFYKLSIIFKGLIAFVLILSFVPFIYWLFVSKTLLQRVIMFFTVIIFVFLVPFIVLFSNKKIEIFKKTRVIKISTYIYKFVKVREILFDEIEAVILKAMAKRGRGYLRTWWQVSLITINRGNINLFATTDEEDSKDIALNISGHLDKEITNLADGKILESKVATDVDMYILKIRGEKINQFKRPKNMYKEDYGKRTNYKWFNINGLEMTMMFLFLYFLIRQNLVMWWRKYPMLSSMIKLTLLFIFYFVIRYIWIVVFSKGQIELDRKGIRVRTNFLFLHKWVYSPWQDLKDVKIESRRKLVFKKEDKSFSVKAGEDKIYWLKNEIDNFIRIHFL